MHIRKHNIHAVGQLQNIDIKSIISAEGEDSDKLVNILQGLQDAYYDPAPLDPLDDGISYVKLVQFAGDDKVVVNAARISFDGDNEEELNARDVKLINYLLSHNHGSPTEHNVLTFKVICPIFVDRQWVRHRVGVSKNEISGRYVEMDERVYKPSKFRAQAKSNRQASVEDEGYINQANAIALWEDAWRYAFGTYHALLSMGVAREQARGILPLALYTENYYSFNLRSLMHFIALRDHEGAQWEMQQYAKALYKLALPIFPETLRIFEELRTHSPSSH